MMSVDEYVTSVARSARDASIGLAKSTPEQRVSCLAGIGTGLRANVGRILEANRADLDEAAKSGLSAAMMDRLSLDAKRIELMASSVEQIAGQPEVVGRIEDEQVRPNGLRVARMRIPIGVISIIYEARPNVTSDAAALCLKSANAVILKGGREAYNSNLAIAGIIRDELDAAGLPRGAVSFIESKDREAVSSLIRQDRYIDLLIPRGGEGLIRFVTSNATVPTIQHYRGNCHIFVEKTADVDESIPVLINAKCQRPGVCNAMETLLLDAGLLRDDQSRILKTLSQNGVRLHADGGLLADFSDAVPNMVPATDDDWDREYLSLDLAVRRVDGFDGAVSHITRHTSLHTEAILTRDEALARRFLAEVNSSTVLVNASTRFADGGELGLGAEMGISTTKLHAFGPMGCMDLTTRKFVVMGNGQVRQ